MLLQRERPRAPFADPAPALLDAIAAREAGFDPSDPAWRAEAPRRAEQQLDRAVGPCGRRLALDAMEHARGRAPAPPPSLRDALQRRHALFGPVEADEPRRAPAEPLLRRADALDVPAGSIQLPSSNGQFRSTGSGGVDVGSRVPVFGEDVLGAVGDAAPRLALNHRRQETITAAHRPRRIGGFKHALVVALYHGRRLLGSEPTRDIAL